MSDSVLASEIYAIRLETLIGVSTNALAIFEFVMTLDREVSSVWKGKRSGASWLLFAVRYTMLASAIEDLVGLTKLNYRGCVVSLITSNILVIFSFLLTAMFSSLRVYALCGGSLKLSAVAFLLQLSPVVVNAYSYVGNTYGVDPIFGCLVDDHFSLKTVDALTLAARIPLIFGDAFVIIITCIKTFQLLKAQHKIGMRLSLSVLLFRDGAVYFIILLILNILELCPLTSYDGGVAIGDLNRALPLILVNQFMLNLRQLDDDGIRTTSQVHTVTTPMFQMSIDIAGNMGESLEYGWESEARGDEELDVQGDLQDNEMLELQETLRDDEPETHDVPRGDEEAGPSECRSE